MAGGSEVSFLHFLVRLDLGRLVGRDDLAVYEHRDAIGEIEHDGYATIEQLRKLIPAAPPDSAVLWFRGGKHVETSHGLLSDDDLDRLDDFLASTPTARRA